MSTNYVTLTKHLVQVFDEKQLTGTITTSISTAYGSPLLFFLYMGMMPDPKHTRDTYYLDFGVYASDNPICSVTRAALKHLATLPEKNWQTIFASKGSEICLQRRKERLSYDQIKSKLKFVIHHEKKIGTNVDDITDEILFAHQDDLLQLKDKTLPYLSSSLIPWLLDILNEDLSNKYPDTNPIVLSASNFCMTKEGFARWREAIQENKPFESFKNLEHLIPYIHPDYKEYLVPYLKDTMARRNAAIASSILKY